MSRSVTVKICVNMTFILNFHKKLYALFVSTILYILSGSTYYLSHTEKKYLFSFAPPNLCRLILILLFSGLTFALYELLLHWAKEVALSSFSSCHLLNCFWGHQLLYSELRLQMLQHWVENVATTGNVALSGKCGVEWKMWSWVQNMAPSGRSCAELKMRHWVENVELSAKFGTERKILRWV